MNTLRLLRPLDLVNAALRPVLSLAVLAMVAIVFLQIAVRFLAPAAGLTISAPWTEEVARYLMVWVIFLGGALAARRGMLIAVQALVDALPARAGYLTQNTALVVAALFLTILAWHGWRWAEFGADETSPVLAISKFWLYLALPLGAGLSALNLLALLAERIHARRHGTPAPNAAAAH